MTQEERAREVLAEHAERYGYPLAAASIRKNDDPWFYTVCARAMLALAAEVREEAAKVAKAAADQRVLATINGTDEAGEWYWAGRQRGALDASAAIRAQGGERG